MFHSITPSAGATSISLHTEVQQSSNFQPSNMLPFTSSFPCSKFLPNFTYTPLFCKSVQLNSCNGWKNGENPHKEKKFFSRMKSNGTPRGFKPLRAASEGLPTELVEDPKFVPLSEDDPRFGPPALLLMGFEHEEISKIQALLKEMDGGFLKVLLCTLEMIKLSLWDAMHVEQADPQTVKIADCLPRICFLSGLSGEETMMFIDAFPEAGLKSTVFAALVPNSAGKTVEELIVEIMGDHERLTGHQQSGQA